MRNFLAFPLLAFALHCSTAQLQAWDAAIAAGTAAVVPAESIGCQIATVLDPTGKTAVCTAIDATGAAVGAAFTVVENAAAIAALVAKTAPKVTLPVAVVLQNEIVRRAGMKITERK